jgi:hypothetical protein
MAVQCLYPDLNDFQLGERVRFTRTDGNTFKRLKSLKKAYQKDFSLLFLGTEQDGQILSIQPEHVVVFFYQNGIKIRKNVRINMLKKTTTVNLYRNNIFCNLSNLRVYFLMMTLFFFPFLFHFVYNYQRPVSVNVTVSASVSQ